MTAVGIVDAGGFWHSDSSHLEEPCRATVLYAVKNPTTGGNTEFCNMYQVYDALPDDLRRRIEGRCGIHHISKAKNPRVTISKARTDAGAYYKERDQATREVLQPMVRTHPAARRSTSRRASPSGSRKCPTPRRSRCSIACSRSCSTRASIIGTSGATAIW